MAGDKEAPTTERDAPDLHRCHGLMLYFVFDNVTNENYNFFILQRDFQGPLKIKWHFYCRSWWRKVLFCFIFMVVVRRPSDKLLPCSPMMRIRFWNAIKRRRRKSRFVGTRCRQKWFNHEACTETLPVTIQFAILLTIRFSKSKFNFPENASHLAFVEISRTQSCRHFSDNGMFQTAGRRCSGTCLLRKNRRRCERLMNEIRLV